MELSRNSLKFSEEIDKYLIDLNNCFPYRFYSGTVKVTAEGLFCFTRTVFNGAI